MPTEMLVLAGGFGTRLQPAVSTVPKPLAPVAGRPYLDYLVEHWTGQGVTSLTFLLHHKADQIVAYVDARQRTAAAHSCSLRTLTEREPLGTGGAVGHAVRELGLTGSFLVTNADTWLGAGVAAVHSRGFPGIGVVRVENTGRYGSVRTEAGIVTAFEEKHDSSGPGWINAGLYHLAAATFRDWDGAAFSLERDLFPPLARARQLRAVELTTQFIDIGIPEDYFRFCRWVEGGQAGTP